MSKYNRILIIMALIILTLTCLSVNAYATTIYDDFSSLNTTLWTTTNHASIVNGQLSLTGINAPQVATGAIFGGLWRVIEFDYIPIANPSGPDTFYCYKDGSNYDCVRFYPALDQVALALGSGQKNYDFTFGNTYHIHLIRNATTGRTYLYINGISIDNGPSPISGCIVYINGDATVTDELRIDNFYYNDEGVLKIILLLQLQTLTVM